MCLKYMLKQNKTLITKNNKSFILLTNDWNHTDLPLLAASFDLKMNLFYRKVLSCGYHFVFQYVKNDYHKRWHDEECSLCFPLLSIDLVSLTSLHQSF